MNEIKPIVSIVIPTYERYKYLYECVEATRSIASDELEIVIQDNTADNKEFVAYIDRISDIRVKYYHKKEHVSVVENCDMGIAHATGDYVCMLGDDDTVCANIVKAAHFLKDNGIEACSFPFPGFYWPDMNWRPGEKVVNMFFPKEADGKVVTLNPKQEIKNKACKGSLGVNMVRVYHGIVSRSCLNRIYEKVGTYFPGPSPDMANAVAVCLEANKAVTLGDYLIVSGYGNASSRGQSRRNEHFGRIEDMPWLPKETRANWDKNTPPIFSGLTIFAVSANNALDRMGANRREYSFDYTGLYASFFWQHKSVRGEFIKFILRSPKRVVWFIKGVFKRVKNRILHIGDSDNNFKELTNIATLAEAKRITEQMAPDVDYHIVV